MRPAEESLERVGDILERVCPCGGDPTAPMHGESLFHRRYLMGLAITNAPDPVRARVEHRQVDDVVVKRLREDLL